MLLPAPDAMDRARALADGWPLPVDVEALVRLRARLLGLTSRGRTSANGSCRLLPTADGWVAVNLARPTDVEAVPAIVEDATLLGTAADVGDPWVAMGRFAATRSSSAVADRCQLLDVPAAGLDDPSVDPRRAVAVHRAGPRAPRRGTPLVVDLSAMWAGPLCARLLSDLGMEVVKVESVHRPDGARAGDPRFYEWLHAGHRSVVLDFREPEGRAALHDLVRQADVVIEASRPRALAHLGIQACEHLRARPGLVWVSITGYGRHGPAAERVAFGDDAAVAGGLVRRDEAGDPVFCGDAIADPLSGLAAAAAAHRSVTAGGGDLVEVSMAAVAARVAGGVRCSSSAPS